MQLRTSLDIQEFDEYRQKNTESKKEKYMKKKTQTEVMEMVTLYPDCIQFYRNINIKIAYKRPRGRDDDIPNITQTELIRLHAYQHS